MNDLIKLVYAVLRVSGSLASLAAKAYASAYGASDVGVQTYELVRNLSLYADLLEHDARLLHNGLQSGTIDMSKFALITKERPSAH